MAIDLTKDIPRSPNDELLGLVSLARAIDKAKAYHADQLGEYHYDCPHDHPLFEFLGVTGEEFAQKVDELQNDQRILAWVKQDLLSKRTAEQIRRFNEERRQWHPAPGTESYDYFMELRSKAAHGRSDIVTWFDLLDLDEKRPVAHPTKLHAISPR